jgi:hypothetical protein
VAADGNDDALGGDTLFANPQAMRIEEARPRIERGYA